MKSKVMDGLNHAWRKEYLKPFPATIVQFTESQIRAAIVEYKKLIGLEEIVDMLQSLGAGKNCPQDIAEADAAFGVEKT